MARVDEPFKLPKRLTPLRLLFIVAFLTGIFIIGSYLVITPLAQLYWGVYARVRPMVSDVDLARQGKALPRKMGETDDAIMEDPKFIDNIADEDDLSEPEVIDTPKIIEEAEEEEEAVDTSSNAHGLTKEMAVKAAGGEGGIVVVTWANYHYRDFVMNWVTHLQKTGCTTFLVGAMDDELLKFLIEKKVPTFGMNSGLSKEDFGWGSGQFHKMGREKIALIKTFTGMKVDVLISDVDTVWMRNPVEYCKRYPDADILTSSDGLTASVQDESLEIYERQGAAYNIGIMLFRSKAAELAVEWMDVLNKDDKVWDQNAFNDLARRGWSKAEGRTDNLFKGYDGKLLVGIFPVSMFCSGHTFFVQNMPKTMGLKPFVAHATFQYSGTEGKRNRFRETFLWNDPDEYFRHETGFISVQHNLPQELLDRAKNFERTGKLETVEHVHFALMNPQLLTVRALFGITIALKRAAVLPEFWCGMDRWWAGHQATIPGSEFALPFICPLDHVMSLENMEKKDLDKNRWGEYVPWREYTFLKKEQARPVAENKLTIKTCKPDETGCSDGSSGAPVIGNIAKLKPKLTGEQIQKALAPLQNKYKLFHFEDATALWGGFQDEETGRKFKERLDLYSSIWCCIPDAHPGHVWYDFFWDVVPHKDRHGRDFTDGWKPLYGP